MSRGCPEGALERGRSGEMVQAEAAAWAQPGGGEAAWRPSARGFSWNVAWGSVGQPKGQSGGWQWSINRNMV